MINKELEAFESWCDICAEIVRSLSEAKAGKTRAVYSPVIAARQNSGLSQTDFARLLDVSVRTLQGWEQGRREPTGAAKALLAIGRRHCWRWLVLDYDYAAGDLAKRA
jgi:putative transcriptional regulator